MEIDQTALQNVELPLTIAGVSEREAKEKAKEMLRLVGLEARLQETWTQKRVGKLFN
jgi:predicted ABC-type transport system involved in lysophospholipase L1 biosynthesis ATPase subunit